MGMCRLILMYKLYGSKSTINSVKFETTLTQSILINLLFEYGIKNGYSHYKTKSCTACV